MPLETRRVSGSRLRLRSVIRAVLERRLPAVWSRINNLRVMANRAMARRKRRLCATYIGVTGSCGKSTSVHLLSSLLADDARVFEGLHQNTEAGVFRALAQLRGPVDYLVQEISGDRPGRMTATANVVQPSVAIVTAVGHDHFPNFKGQLGDIPNTMPVMDRYRELIAEEKGMLVEALAPDGVACLNADQDLVKAMAARCNGRVVLYGTSADAEVRAENVTAAWPERLSFDLVIGAWRRRVQTRFVGTMALGSVLAALAGVRAVGGDLDRAANRLADLDPLPDRTGVRLGRDGHTYVVDTIKAPLWQVELLLEDLPNFEAESLVFVLGEVSDTRNDKSKTYRRLLRRASQVADHVVGFGQCANSANRVRAGGGHDNVAGFETYDQVMVHLRGLPPSLVFLKSNKTARLERIWEAVAPD